MFIIGISGGSGSGKTTVVNQLLRRFPRSEVQVISQDAYYHDRGHLTAAEKLRYNFDHPSAIDFDLMVSHIHALQGAQAIARPVYDYVSCARSDQTIVIAPVPVLLVEGILVFTFKPLREMMHMRVFIDAEPDERLIRIVGRDIRDRGRSVEDVFNHYQRFVRPMHQRFIEPSKRFADLVITSGGHNGIATDALAAHISQIIRNRKYEK
jgi:uridine kinase